MTRHTITREVSVTEGNSRWLTTLSWVEVRYTFDVLPGRKAVTWANASGGFSPEEAPSVDLVEVAIRTHRKHDFTPLDGVAFDAFSADLSDKWFLEQIEEDAA
jgi:hypothetical protein